jgi:hypothetical protein
MAILKTGPQIEGDRTSRRWLIFTVTVNILYFDGRRKDVKQDIIVNCKVTVNCIPKKCIACSYC